MLITKISIRSLAIASVLVLCATATAQEMTTEAKILEALRAAPSGIAKDATVKDWDGSILRAGTNGWACYPGPEFMPHSPMCLDAVWEKWAQAWATKGEFKTDKIGISYMLMGDSGGSNTDPYAMEPTEDNEWVVEGPHLMILVPDEAMLEALPDDPDTGGPYVMWKGTPYAHIMVPVH